MAKGERLKIEGESIEAIDKRPLAFSLMPFAMFIYSALYAAALVVLLPFEYLKREGELRERWLRERFGIYPPRPPLTKGGIKRGVDKRTVWIHAVSVGEVIASVPLIKNIKQKYPSLDIIISTV